MTTEIMPAEMPEVEVQDVALVQDSLSRAELVARSRKVLQVMEDVMKEGVHFGTIPGTPKPSLWQPGAEKLAMVFQLAPEFTIEDLSTGDAIRYRVVARVTHMASCVYVGSGVGEASSDEAKYRWRAVVCDEEWEATPEDRRRLKWSKNRGGKSYSVQQIRTEPADIANTVLKMAKKRAFVDAVKSTCAASDLFGQDLEDLPDPETMGEEGGSARKVSQPQEKKAAPADSARQDGAPPIGGAQEEPSDLFPEEPKAAPEGGVVGPWEEIRNAWHDKGTISEKQAKRLFAIAHGEAGLSFDEVRQLLDTNLGCKIEEIPWGKPYDLICEFLETQV